MSHKYLSVSVVRGRIPSSLSPSARATCGSPRASVHPTDEKEESILGSIPLLSFRVAAVQPSDNISRKHTFKVSWHFSPRPGGGGGPALVEHAGLEKDHEPPPQGAPPVVAEGKSRQ